MPERVVIIGCGPRATEHVYAYRLVRGAEVVAACAREIDHARTFCLRHSIERAYGDADEMLRRETPDLVHIVTGPLERLNLMRVVHGHGIPVAIVEKPIATDVGDRNAIGALAIESSTRFLVNTQLPLHPRLRALLDIVNAGNIGAVHRIDASAGSTILDQGVHLIDLAQRFAGDRPFDHVFANVSGSAELASPQPCPDDLLASVGSANGVTLNLVVGSMAPVVRPTEPFYMQKRIQVDGSDGWVSWTMWGWQACNRDAVVTSGNHAYGAEDVLAQAAFTTAALGVVRGGPVPPFDLERSLEQFDVVLAAYLSALEHRVVPLPIEPSPLDGLLGRVGQALTRMA